MLQLYNDIFLTPEKNKNVLYELLWKGLEDLLQMKDKNGAGQCV